MEARRANASDIDVVVSTLVASHLDYVWEVWAFPVPREIRREQMTRLLRAHCALVDLPHRETWMTDDGASVAVWRSEPSDPIGGEDGARLAELTSEVFGDRLAAIEEVDAVLLAHRPDAPHRFLGTMGTRPERRRQGSGAAVLRPALDRLDRDGMPACLETSAASNVAFYGALGFEVVAHLDALPADAPETWVMWRTPAAHGVPG